MSQAELLPVVRALPRSEKYQPMHELIADLAESEWIADGDYPIWSPYEAHEAAATLVQILENEAA